VKKIWTFFKLLCVLMAIGAHSASYAQCWIETVGVFGETKVVCAGSSPAEQLLREQRRTNQLLEQLNTQNQFQTPQRPTIDSEELRRALQDIKTMNEPLPTLRR
jgi:hypothetical protein